MDEPQKAETDIIEELSIENEQSADAHPSAEELPSLDQSAFKTSFCETKNEDDKEKLSSNHNQVEPLPFEKPANSQESDMCPDNQLDFSLSIESPNDMKTVLANMEHLGQDVKTIAESSAKTASEIREMHKLYHNEFANRLQSMQEELERYREIDKGRAFDGILGEVAKLYADNESVLDDVGDEKAKKQLRYMFLDIIQILEANGVMKHKSNPGDKRNTKYCQVIERVATETSELHDTIVRSRGTGFYVDNRPLIKEPVDIYLFTEKNAKISAEN